MIVLTAEAKNEFEDESEYCLKVKPKRKEYQWSNCSEKLQDLCDFGKLPIPTSFSQVVTSHLLMLIPHRTLNIIHFINSD